MSAGAKRAEMDRRDNERRDGQVGRQIKELRRRVNGRTQEKIADAANVSTGTVAAIEQGQGGGKESIYAICRVVDAEVLVVPAVLAPQIEQFVESYSLGNLQTAMLDICSYCDGRWIIPHNRCMDCGRRGVVIGAPALALDLATPEVIRKLLSPGAKFPGLTPDQIDALAADCDTTLTAQCDAWGGGSVLHLGILMHKQASAWLNEPNHLPRVRRALQALCCDLEVKVGWLAIDAEDSPMAERYLNKAISRAHIMGYPATELRALENLSYLQLRMGHYQLAQETAERALYLAPADTSSRVLAALHWGAGSARARLGDAHGFDADMARAGQQLDRASPFIPKGYYWVAPAVAPLEVAPGASVLGQHDRAVAALRTFAENPTGYRTQDIFAKVQLGLVLARQGDMAGAAETGTSTLSDVMDVSSGRSRKDLRQLYGLLSRQHPYAPRVRDFVYAYEDAMDKHRARRLHRE